MLNSIAQRFVTAHNRGVPLVAIETPDPEASIRSLCERVVADLDEPLSLLRWDSVAGFVPLNENAKGALDTILDGMDPASVTYPADALIAARKLRSSIVFVVGIQRYLSGNSPVELLARTTQAIANLRDDYKTNGAMLVLVGQGISLPQELATDTLCLDEPLPSREFLSSIAKAVCDSAEATIDAETTERMVDALRGVAAFGAEQAIALSLREDGSIDVDGLWDLKRKLISGTPGLRVYGGTETFQDVGGCDAIKSFLTALVSGKEPPNAFVFMDEIEKKISSGENDTSMVGKGQLGNLLTEMEDSGADGLIFVGPPGCSKSLIAKAAGNEAKVPTIEFDLGAAKNSLVGESEARTREALRVIRAVSDGKALYIATCNAIADLPPELLRRFSLGIYFFDLPDRTQRETIWKMYVEKYGLDESEFPLDEQFTGAEIRNVCRIAYKLRRPIEQAKKSIVPVTVSGAKMIEELRRQASGRYLNADDGGIYRHVEGETSKVEPGKPAATGSRMLKLKK